MEEKELNIVFSQISKTCEKCKWGLILNPNDLKCAKYKNGKPYYVYFEGQDCPLFEQQNMN